MLSDYQILEFKNSVAWRTWLDDNHMASDGVWLRTYKKASGVASVTYTEALDEALCYGWIDGQRKSYDELSFIQKFTPRRARSIWSKRNVEHVARLTNGGAMMPAGFAEVERAKLDGRWDAAYDSAKNMEIPADFLLALKQNQKAEAFFDTLNKTSRYAIGFKLQTAKKPETRANRIAVLITMLENNQKP